MNLGGNGSGPRVLGVMWPTRMDESIYGHDLERVIELFDEHEGYNCFNNQHFIDHALSVAVEAGAEEIAAFLLHAKDANPVRKRQPARI